MTLLPKAFALRKEFIDLVPMDPLPSGPRCLLFDNGSLRPESTIALRGVAQRLQAALGVEVKGVSLRHSDLIPPADVGGVPAQLLEPALGAWLAAGGGRVVVLPLFFGPSAALVVHLPQRLERLCRKHPGMDVRLGRWLVDPSATGDVRIASMLADRVRAVIADCALDHPQVVMVDHGSPRREVIEVRDFLAGQLATVLGGSIGRLAGASMERRPGADYDFCEPLLASVLRRPPFCHGPVVVAQQFFSPGRHAGPGGDVAAICAAAENEQPRLRTYPTELLGADPRLVEVLADRYRVALEREPRDGTSMG